MNRPGSTPQGLGSAPHPMGPPDPTRLRMGTFDDRVMASVALEPTPTAARVFVRSLLALRWREAAAALATAWHLAFGASRSIPSFVRAQALALLVVTTLVVGTGGTFAAAGALRVLEGRSEPPVIDLPVLVVDPTPRLMPNLANPSPSPDPDRADTEGKPAKQQKQDVTKQQEPGGADKRGSGSGTKTQSQEPTSKRQQDGSRQQTSDGADKRESGSGTKSQSQDSTKAGGGPSAGSDSPTKSSDQDPKKGSN